MIETDVEANSVPKSSGELLTTIVGDDVWYTSIAEHLSEKH